MKQFNYRSIIFVNSVCYIAGQLVDALNKHIPESETGLKKWFTDEEKMCVQIAALCHDIGMYRDVMCHKNCIY